MKVIVDDKIPYIRPAIESLADEVVYYPGSKFTPQLVKEADVLIIRTRTRCDAALLKRSQVKYIATATIGYDHIDTDYLAQAGIAWSNAPGCNSRSVAQYMTSVFLLLAKEKDILLSQATLGIVGVGYVGKEVQKIAQYLGMRVLCNDPLRAAQEGEDGFSDMETLQRECNIISFHTPLTRIGEHATFHLADATFFAGLKKQPCLINTSRGEVIETQALKDALKKKQVSEAVIDVWENEPYIDKELLRDAFIATPHIAGYSADGKSKASRISIENICRYFKLNLPQEVLPPLPEDTKIIAPTMADALLKIYTPHQDSRALKEQIENFEYFRSHYPLRREKEAYEIKLI